MTTPLEKATQIEAIQEIVRDYYVPEIRNMIRQMVQDIMLQEFDSRLSSVVSRRYGEELVSAARDDVRRQFDKKIENLFWALMKDDKAKAVAE